MPSTLGDAPGAMQVGDVVAGRFLLQRLVAAGGSAKVYLAFDRSTNSAIALKVLSTGSQVDDQRFRAEARILAELSHPKIVRYVAHGETPALESYIAMQWLEGETLAERIARESLSVSDAVSIIRQTAEALVEPHQRGLVHRDLKPSNLFLVDGRPSNVKVLDFGIAKFLRETGERTSSGTFLGTMGYMAPEQALAARDADARADVFALGCVLFESLTGRPVFAAQHAVALLAKVLTEPAPRLTELIPKLAGQLDSLVARMLSKDPAERPADATALIREIDAIANADPDSFSYPPGSAVVASLTGFERRVISVALLEAASGDLSGREQTKAVAASFGAEASLLSNGTLLLLLSGGGTAADRATQAAACTLAVRRVEPTARIVLSTGWVDASSRAPVGPVIDRAAELLHALRSERSMSTGVVLDTTTARLLASRFEIRETASTALLVGERSGHEPPRLLGKATPCVGRDKELAFLRTALSECVAERAPRAVLVTADAGVGKSRLAREFMASVVKEGGRVLLAKSDSTGAGSAFQLARQLVRAACRPGEPLSALDIHAALAARLLAALGSKRADVCGAFLCELLGVPVEAALDSVLSSARADARLMSEWMRRSFEEWISVEAAEPLVIVLEDLHWGDAPTVTYLSGALARRDLPLLVLALARPEVHDAFPKLWAGAQLEVVGLSRLRRSAAEALVRSVLPEIAPATIERIVERADGNAFYLEELIRAVAEGRGDRLPETVIAMAHAGLARLDQTSRRALRAASVFGERFTAAGVDALLREGAAGLAALDVLEEREVVSRVRSDATEEKTYAFRHALLRDAAYETLTDADRTNVHLLAADWLERRGNADPVVMADHLERGGEPRRAVAFVVRAAELAYAAGSPDDTRKLCARGIPHAFAENLGALLVLDGASALLQSDYRTATDQLRAAKPLLDPASDRWFLGVSTLAYASTVAGAPTAAVEFVESILGLSTLPVRNPLCAFGIARGVLTLSFAGDSLRALSLVDRVDIEAARHPALNPSSEGWLHLARGFSFMAGVRTLPDAAARASATMDLFEEAHDDLAIPSALCWLGAMRGCVGDYQGAADVEREAIARSHARGNLISPSLMKPLLELARAIGGDPGSALEELGRPASHANPLGDSVLSWVRGYVLYLLGRLDDAEAVSRATIAMGIPISAHAAATTLARVLLERGRPGESLGVATACVERNLRDPFFLSADAALVRAEALMALGRADEARAALAETKRSILDTAAALPGGDRETYLTSVPSNARALQLVTDFS